MNTIFAVYTPFTSDDAVDAAAIAAQCQWLNDHNASTIIVNGTTGEFSSMTAAEQFKALRQFREHFSGELIANVSSSSYLEVQHKLQQYEGYADSFMISPPYYFPIHCEESIFNFVAACLQKTLSPLWFYHRPLIFSHNKLSSSFFRRLLSIGNLAGIKESSGDLNYTASLRSNLPSGIRFGVGAGVCPGKAWEAGFSEVVTSEVSLAGWWDRVTCKSVLDCSRQLNSHLQTREAYYATFPESLLKAQKIPLRKFLLSRRVSGFNQRVRPPLRDVEMQ